MHTPSTSKLPETKFAAGSIASSDAASLERWLAGLGQGAELALPYLFEVWAMPHQLPPEGDWRAWVILGGRGAGKTRAGAEWVRSVVEGSKPLDHGRCRRLALVGETQDQVREVMIFGDSGIMACSPPDRRPEWKASRKCLVWPNGAEAMAFSAHEPEGLRGPQFDGAWVDELAKWRKGQDTWDMLQFALRLGERPQVCVTTTPRNVAVLKRLLEAPSTVSTHAPTEANRANLAESFLQEVRARYAGTRLGRQELDGVLFDDVEGALWTEDLLDGARGQDVPVCGRIVVAVDPPASSGAKADTCGIVVAGLRQGGQGPDDLRAVVLEDASVQGLGPSGWAQAALDAMARWQGDRLVAEVNQGGDMVEAVIRSLDPHVPLTKVHASRGKAARAEPVAALYEQGRVAHAPGFELLEEQMCRMTAQGYEGAGSPDRVDALVWALTDLVLRAPRSRPALRTL
ncbi:DNA-packaging protein [Roseivivax sediminis]|uniref:Large terminase phage packaging protein n=1 Tax=Roseivivax sediminis TaxID=936889 RepID=A0A1I1T695_9RHOB|nr:terminase family protein [Roseivivax sediminis]SFD54112.1 Large terminase phage packaging protein [Roseivivax sediminis]